MATPRKAPEDRLPLGRPSKYKPEFCEQAIAYGKLGKSRAWIAATFDIAKSNLQMWEKEYPDFQVAMARAKTFEQLWWEDKGQENLAAVSFQSSMWNRSMAARFPDDWREKTEQLHDATDKFAGLYGKLTPDVFPKKAENEDDGA